MALKKALVSVIHGWVDTRSVLYIRTTVRPSSSSFSEESSWVICIRNNTALFLEHLGTASSSSGTATAGAVVGGKQEYRRPQ